MQKSTSILLLALCFSVFASTAEARTSKRTTADSTTNTTTSERIVTHQAAAEHHDGPSFGLGLSSISPVQFAAVSGFAGVPGSITGIIALDGVNSVQFFAAIPSTATTFQFGLAGLFKHTIWGTKDAGFHLGGGLGLGTNGNFTMDVDGVIGIHYALGGSPVVLHLDGGPVLTIQTLSGVAGGSSSTQTSFGMGSFSSLIGASVVYIL